MTTIKLSPKLDDDTGVLRAADTLYDRVKDRVPVIGLLSIDNHVVDAFGKRTVLVSLDTLELADGDDAERQVRELLADLIENRGGDPTMPFPESDAKRYTRMLAEWQTEEGHDDADVQRLWAQHFNPSDDPDLAVTGPVGAEPQHLREFLGYVGAIDETTPEPAGDDSAGETDSSDDEQTAAGENGDDEDTGG